MEAGDSFWLFAFLTIVGLGVFAWSKNIIIKFLSLLLGVGGLASALLYWNSMDGTAATMIIIIVFFFAGITTAKEAKSDKSRRINVVCGVVLALISLIAFLYVTGVLTSSSGALQEVGQAINNGWESLREVFGFASEGVEELNR